MPTFERRRVPRGYTYLLLLLGLAVGGAGLASLGTQWQVAAQREREAEWLFRGLQLRDALLRYHDQTPAGQPRLPLALDELLEDRRHAEPRHHLRRLFADPFTGQADWILLRAPDGRITGFHSRSDRPLLRRHGMPEGLRLQSAPRAAGAAALVALPAPARARDWQFFIPVRPGRPGTRP